MFIRVTEIDYGDKVIINTNNISYIHETANIVFVNSVHGEGNGILRLDNISIKKILDNIEIR